MYLRCCVRLGALPKQFEALAPLFVLTLLSIVSPVNAETVQELPPIIVEGATLGSSQPGEKPAKPQSSNTAPAKVSNEDASAESASRPQSTEGVPLEQIGAAVSVVTRKDLDQRQIRYVADALRGLPGVEVSSPNGPGGLTQVRLRGVESNHTLVLIDGIEANNPTDGEFDFSNLDASDVERIEVIRGPMSGIYGSSAVGGVINIVTRGGRGPLTFSARTEGAASAPATLRPLPPPATTRGTSRSTIIADSPKGSTFRLPAMSPTAGICRRSRCVPVSRSQTTSQPTWSCAT